MDVIRDVLIELRPRLRSCNVSILTQRDFADQYDLKVSVRPNFIIINYVDYQIKQETKSRNGKLSRKDSSSSYESFSESDDEGPAYSKYINVTQHCKILPSSLSFLKIENEFISFRLLTEPVDSTTGTFFSEIVNNPITEYTMTTKATDDFVHITNKSINLSNQDKVKILCANCSHNLTILNNEENNYITFNRILELPSENLDVSDWFCHGECNSEKITKYVPRNSDLFHGLCCFIINTSNLRSNFIEFNKTRNIIHCDRCLFWLGINYDLNSIKFWNSCVKFSKSTNTEDESNIVFFSQTISSSLDSISLDNFLYVIKYGIKNSFFSAVSPSCKILLECDISKDNKQHILLWVMDKFLDVLVPESNPPNSFDSDDKNPADEIKLKHILTSKLMYRIEGISDDVKTWSDDSSVQTFEISKDMFIEGKKHLAEMALHIPCGFRKSNEFLVTYLKI